MAETALENFRLPKSAVAAGLPDRVRPIFRDREVLGSSHDLSKAITDALHDSEYLVVVCSPRVRQVLGRAYLELNAADRALPLLEANADLVSDFLGPDHPRTSSALPALGNTYNALGDHRRGADIHQRLLDRAIRLNGEKSEDALEAMTNLAISLGGAGRREEANTLRARVYELGRDTCAPGHLGFQTARRDRSEEGRAICLRYFGNPPDERKLGIIDKSPADLP